MKKILALVLACVMLASMFTVNAFAANANIFGAGGGVTSVPAAGAQTNNTGNVNVTVSTITHCYSVDLDYTDANFTLPTLVWNVSDLKYDVTNAGTLDANFKLTVTNYSDLSVKATVAVADVDGADFLSITMDKTTETVAAVTVDSYTATGTATTAVFTGSLTEKADAEKILDAVTYFAEGAGKGKVADNKAIIATYTVTIS